MIIDNVLCESLKKPTSSHGFLTISIVVEFFPHGITSNFKKVYCSIYVLSHGQDFDILFLQIHLVYILPSNDINDPLLHFINKFYEDN